MSPTGIYTIERLRAEDLIEKDTALFCQDVGRAESELYADRKFNWRNFNIRAYCERHRFMLIRRRGTPVGVMLSKLFTSDFDPLVKILFCDLLYVKPGSGRAAYLLVQDFLTFGKQNAQHINMSIAEKTNIKPRSLERLGFKKAETYFRYEVK
jgi:hypothetical protein